MKLHRYISALFAVLLLAVLPGCSSSDEPSVLPVPEQPGEPAMTTLKLYIQLDRDNAGAAASAQEAAPASRASMGASASRASMADAADDREKMHTVRIVIVDQNNVVEHSTLWNLSNYPDVTAVGDDFPVKANETKTVLLIANEASATITLSDGRKVNVGDYMQPLAAIGAYMPDDLIRSFVHNFDDNKVASGFLKTPLLMTAVHKLYVDDSPTQSATLFIHRAAVKYIFRFTVKDTKQSHHVSNIAINNVASAQYLFPDADFSDSQQQFLTAYRALGAAASDLSIPVDLDVAPGKTVEVGPYYLPEGAITAADKPYSVRFVVDDVDSHWLPLYWQDEQQSASPQLMTDLCRNTAVVVNVSLTSVGFSVDYTRCPWNIQEIDIPPFN